MSLLLEVEAHQLWVWIRVEGLLLRADLVVVQHSQK